MSMIRIMIRAIYQYIYRPNSPFEHIWFIEPNSKAWYYGYIKISTNWLSELIIQILFIPNGEKWVIQKVIQISCHLQMSILSRI